MYHKTFKSLVLDCWFRFQITYDVCKTQATEMVSDILDHHVQAISPFPTMFSTPSKTEITIFVTFNLSSANALNLVTSKILSCGNGLNRLLSLRAINPLPDDKF